MVREKNIEKVENVKGSEDLNKKHSGQVLRSKSSATAFVATILPCEVGASKGERANMDLQEVRTNGLLVVCFIHSNHFDWMFSNVVQIPMQTWIESGPIPKTVGFREICNGCRSNLAGNSNLFCGGRDATVFA